VPLLRPVGRQPPLSHAGSFSGRDRSGGEKEYARVLGSRPGDRFDALRNALHRRSRMNDAQNFGPDLAHVGGEKTDPGLHCVLSSPRGLGQDFFVFLERTVSASVPESCKAFHFSFLLYLWESRIISKNGP
jgi:hypothetical protein